MKTHKKINHSRFTACGLRSSEDKYPFKKLLKTRVTWKNVDCKKCNSTIFLTEERPVIYWRKMKRSTQKGTQ